MAGTRFYTEPLASEGDWSAYLDQDNTGMVYYFNAKTGESMWEPPTETFPSAKMNLKTRQAARAKQSEFRKQAEEPKQVDELKKKGFLSSILEKEKDQLVKEDRVDEEQPNWFDGLFEIKAETPTKEDAGYFSGKAETPKKEDTGFLSGFLGGRRKEEEPNGAVNGDNKLASDIQAKAKFSTMFTGSNVGTLPIQLDVASVVLPHPQKVSWGGEDAVFVKGRTFGVFDGVSGADKLDGIPLFSYTLADEMKRMLNDEGVTIKQIIDSLNDAADFANRAATGASTAVVGAIGKDGFLRVLNIGDSACLVVRGDKVIARTKEIVHYFDCPYQFSEDSPDRAQDGTRLNFEVLPGDVVIMGSDGVFDNLDDKRIVDEIRASPERATVIARRIVDLSRQVSLDDDAPTPYAKLAKRNGFEDFQTGRGGKLDDVSCVVVRCT
jgi:protein phosphatase PTC7